MAGVVARMRSRVMKVRAMARVGVGAIGGDAARVTTSVMTRVRVRVRDTLKVRILLVVGGVRVRVRVRWPRGADNGVQSTLLLKCFCMKSLNT